MTDDKRSDTILRHFACRTSQYKNHYPINVAINNTETSMMVDHDQQLSNFTDNFAHNDPSAYYASPVMLYNNNFSCGKRVRYGCMKDSLCQHKN